MKLRAKALYDEDTSRQFRKSHENKQIQALYENYLQAPGSHISHEILHTHYKAKARFDIKDKE